MDKVAGGSSVLINADGSCLGNPGPGGWAVLLQSGGHEKVLSGADPHTTNNRMELTGAINGLGAVRDVAGPVSVYTDSTYVIQGIREWIHGWRRRGWKTAAGADVLNRELWEALSELTARRGPRTISWHYVRGHVGTPGNERVDQIADAFATRAPVTLYDGPLIGYPVAILDLPEDTAVPARSKGSNGGVARPAAYSYLSVVDGKPMRHATWAECERRVKGRSGALFKKATSAADQDAILRSWRFSPDDV